MKQYKYKGKPVSLRTDTYRNNGTLAVVMEHEDGETDVITTNLNSPFQSSRWLSWTQTIIQESTNGSRRTDWDSEWGYWSLRAFVHIRFIQYSFLHYERQKNILRPVSLLLAAIPVNPEMAGIEGPGETRI